MDGSCRDCITHGCGTIAEIVGVYGKGDKTVSADGVIEAVHDVGNAIRGKDATTPFLQGFA